MIKIFTVPHTMFAALHLIDQLKKLKYEAKIVDAINTVETTLYIIYNAAALNRRQMPRNYIVMQTEIATSHWFNSNYHNILSRARAIWDYSERNVLAYRSINKRTCIVSPGINLKPQQKKDIDFLFYGWLEGSPRRTRIVDELKKEIPSLMIVTNLLGSEMWALLNRTKVVINVHYFDDSPLELYRIHEALSHNCHVVSEGFEPLYKRFVEFESVPEHIASSAVVKSAIDFKHDLAPLDNIRQIVHGLILAGK